MVLKGLLSKEKALSSAIGIYSPTNSSICSSTDTIRLTNKIESNSLSEPNNLVLMFLSIYRIPNFPE